MYFSVIYPFIITSYKIRGLTVVLPPPSELEVVVYWERGPRGLSWGCEDLFSFSQFLFFFLFFFFTTTGMDLFSQFWLGCWAQLLRTQQKINSTARTLSKQVPFTTSYWVHPKIFSQMRRNWRRPYFLIFLRVPSCFEKVNFKRYL